MVPLNPFEFGVWVAIPHVIYQVGKNEYLEELTSCSQK